MTATATPTANEAALAAVPNAKKTVIPPVKPPPARKIAGTKKGILADVAAKMEQDGKAKTAAIKAGKLTKKERSTGNGSGPVARLTMEWTGKDGKDVEVKDRVKTADGTVIDVIGRWTKKTAKGNVPMVTGHIVSIPTAVALASVPASGEGKGKQKGDRLNAVAAEVTHTK